jgi:hypothetical protein
MTILKESPQAFINSMEEQQLIPFVTCGIAEVCDLFDLLGCV